MKNKKIKLLSACLGFGLISVSNAFIYQANTNPNIVKADNNASVNVSQNKTVEAKASTVKDEPWPASAIPSQYLNISDGILSGFTSDMNLSIMDLYSNLLIPSDVKEIDYSFSRDWTTLFTQTSQNYTLSFQKWSQLVEIQDYAFYKLMAIQTVDFSNCDMLCDLTSSEVFYSCRSLSQIIFPPNIKYIGQGCFACDVSLNDVDLSSCKSLISLETKCFASCIWLKSVKLPDCLKRLGGFIGDFNLSDINFPTGLLSIAADAFNGCSPLTNIDLSKCTNLRKIYSNAFVNCSNITNVVLPLNIESIENGAFVCAKIDFENLCIPSSLKYFSGAFNFSNYSYTNTDIFLYSKKAYGMNIYCIQNPNFVSIGYYPEISIKDGTFANCSLIELKGITYDRIKFPSSFKFLNGWDFAGFNGKELDFSKTNIDQIVGKLKAQNNNNISNIIFPESTANLSLVTIDGFPGISSLDLTYLKKLRTIPTFSQTSLKNIFFPSSITKVFTNCFRYASKQSDWLLKEINFHSCNNLYSIEGDGSNAKSEGINNFILPSSILDIGKNAFSYWNDLKYLNFDELSNLQVIDQSAFFQDISLDTINLKKAYNLQQIKSNAFYNCVGINNILLPNSLNLIDYNSFYEVIVQSISLPWNKKQLNSSSFWVDGIENLPHLVGDIVDTIYIPIGTTEQDYIDRFGDLLPTSYLSPNVTWESSYNPPIAPDSKSSNSSLDLNFILMISFGGLAIVLLITTIIFGVKSTKNKTPKGPRRPNKRR